MQSVKSKNFELLTLNFELILHLNLYIQTAEQRR